MKLKYLFVLLLFSLTHLSCASTYQSRTAGIHRAAFRGDYALALEKLETLKPASKDALLYLLDKGILLHRAGRYAESNKVLSEAEDLSEVLTIKSLSRETGATFWNEEGIEYAGDRHERLMIPVIRLLNYLGMQDWAGAQVEVKRIGTLTEKVTGHRDAYTNDLILYLSALVYEMQGLVNDAWIDTKRLAERKAAVPYYGHDLEAFGKRLGLPVDKSTLSPLAWKASPSYRQKKAQLVVIVETGRAPMIESVMASNGAFTFAAPTLRPAPSGTRSVLVTVDDEALGDTAPFYQIIHDAKKAVAEREKVSLKRQMAKVAAQVGLYGSGIYLAHKQSKKSKAAGLGMALLGLTMSAAEKADERSWQTLPAEFQIGRFYLDPGPHKIVMSPSDGRGVPLEKDLIVQKGKATILIVNFP